MTARVALIVAPLLGMMLVSTALAKPPAIKPEVILMMGQDIEMIKATLESNYKQMQVLKKDLELLKKDGTGKDKASADELVLKIQALEMNQKLLTEQLESLSKKVEAQAKEDEKPTTAWKGMIRLRPEYSTNMHDLDSDEGDADAYVNQKVQLGLTFQPLDWLGFHAQIQHYRAWGEADEEQAFVLSELTMHQAFLSLDIGSFWDQELTLSGGRMELSFGSERLVGADPFSQSGRAFDTFLVSYNKPKRIKADAFAATIKERTSLTGQDLGFYGLYLSSDVLEGTAIDVYGLFLYDSMEDNEQKIMTIGARFAGLVLDGLYFDLEAVIQLGEVQKDGQDLQHFATAYYAKAGWEFKGVPVLHRFGAFVSTASGDGNPDDDRSVDFIPLFPSSHQHWGMMNLVRWSNIIDGGGELQLDLTHGALASVSYHYFALVTEEGSFYGLGKGYIPGPQESYGTDIGHEIDLQVSMEVNDVLHLQTGYSIFVPGAASQNILLGKSAAHWLYFQATAVF